MGCRMKVKIFLIFFILFKFLNGLSHAENQLPPKGSIKLSSFTGAGVPFKIEIGTTNFSPECLNKDGWRWGAEQNEPKYIIKKIEVWIDKEKNIYTYFSLL